MEELRVDSPIVRLIVVAWCAIFVTKAILCVVESLKAWRSQRGD